jgi:hypothetical protein
MGSLDEKTIISLISLKQEGGYWDFKREWHTSKTDLLHDIICMANNLEARDGYIIIGVDEENDYSICGVTNDENRRKTQNIVDFLRDKTFAEGIRPTISVKSIMCDNTEIDVLTIHFDRHTPYYLTERFEGVNANNIYIRIQDTNTPKNRSADIHHIETLWKRRFGLDASVMERYLILLDQHEQWECDFGNHNPAFHKLFPEFKIEADNENSRDGWEPQGAYYLNPDMGFRSIKLLYFSTPIFEWGIMDVSGGSIFIPYPRRQCYNILIGKSNFFYDYYDLSKIEGKLFKMMTSGNLQYDNQHFNTYIHLFLIFNNEEERKNFDNFSTQYYEAIDIDLLKTNPRVSLALRQAKSKEKNEEHVLGVAIASELYSLWYQQYRLQ